MDTNSQPGNVGDLLRHWRGRRRLSQLELASRASVSTRHLSFLENNRSTPTRTMLATLAEHLDLDPRATNRLFLAADYAAPHTERPLDDKDLAPVLDSLRQLLDAHLPWPALLLDDYWEIIDANEAAHRMLDGCDRQLLEPPINAILITLDPGGLAPRIRNFAEWAGHLVTQLRHRTDASGDPRLISLLNDAERLTAGCPLSPQSTSPVLMLELCHQDQVLRYFSVAARLETAIDLTAAGLHLETFLPADAVTAAHH